MGDDEMGMHEVIEEIQNDLFEMEQQITHMENMKKKEVDFLRESQRDLSQRLDRLETLMESMTLLLKRITEALES